MKNQFKDQPFEIIGISYDDSATTVEQFLRRTPVNYPIVMNTSQISSQLGDISGLPTTYIYGKNFKFYTALEGYQSQNTLHSIIVKLLNDPN